MTAPYVRGYGAAEGPALLALHGIKGHGARWRRIAETSLYDFSVIAPDLRGHGRSDHAPPWNTEAHVADMLAVLDARDVDRVDLLAHSFGGLIALRLAHAAPERVGRIVLLDPSVGLPAGQLHQQARRTLCPGSFDQGTSWVLHRKRLDLRVVRRLVKDACTPVIWGDMGGTSPRLTAETERPMLWDRIKGDYKGPGGTSPTGRYLAHEFRAEPGRRMLYVEDDC